MMEPKWRLFVYQLLILPAFMYSNILSYNSELLVNDIISGECGSCGDLVNYARKNMAGKDQKIRDLEISIKQKDKVQEANLKVLLNSTTEKLNSTRRKLIEMEHKIIELQLIMVQKSQELDKLKANQTKQQMNREKELNILKISSASCQVRQTLSISKNGALLNNVSSHEERVSVLYNNLRQCQVKRAGLGHKLSTISQNLLSKMFNLFRSINKKESNILGLGLFNELYASNTAGPGWFIIMRRVNDIENFNRSWEEYVDGFGNVRKGFWFGLEKLRKLTKERRYELFIEIVDSRNKTHYTKYDDFQIGDSAQDYPLKSIGNDTGNIKKLLNSQLGRPFSAVNADNSNATHCPHVIRSGWWYADCDETNLTGNRLGCDIPKNSSRTGCILSKESDSSIYPIKYVQMMIRPYKQDT